MILQMMKMRKNRNKNPELSAERLHLPTISEQTGGEGAQPTIHTQVQPWSSVAREAHADQVSTLNNRKSGGPNRQISSSIPRVKVMIGLSASANNNDDSVPDRPSVMLKSSVRSVSAFLSPAVSLSSASLSHRYQPQKHSRRHRSSIAITKTRRRRQWKTAKATSWAMTITQTMIL